MGMYTELVLNCELKNDPTMVRRWKPIIDYMLGNTEEKPETPDHPLFTEHGRWSWMLRSSSYYFTPYSNSGLKEDNLYENKPMYFLHVKTDLKNYESEIENFLKWLKTYIDDSSYFLGYYIYEEDNFPTLIFNRAEELGTWTNSEPEVLYLNERT